MSDEEKKAIEKLKEYALCKVNDNGYVEVSANGYKHTILNLIENQQKELNNIKEIEKSHKEENGLLRQELDMQIEHNKELEATLKQTQNSWFEDTQKLEQEKEKNKELEKHYKHEQEYINGEVFSAKQMHIIDEDYISKDKIREIVNEHIPRQPNIITGEIEYTPNTNANSFLVQDILELLEMN